MATPTDWLNVFEENLTLFLLLIVWSLIWKGLALWRAARLNRLNWFVAILLINSLGILELVYLFFVAPRQTTRE